MTTAALSAVEQMIANMAKPASSSSPTVMQPPATQVGQSVPLTEVEQLAGKISQLADSLGKAAPGWESMLFYIHKALAQNEELAILLTEEQIGVICAGLAKRKNIVIATSVSSKKGTLKSLAENL